MIKLFDPDNYIIDTSKFNNLLHDEIVSEFEESFAEYVGAKYACSINSATNAIFLIFLNKNLTIDVPSMIPPVVLNALITSGNKINFIDDVDWIGGSYILHNFGDFKVIDSAQRVDKNQFKNEANDDDLMFFSFYPTKPVGGSDGGMIVSNDYQKIQWFKEAVMNGMSYSDNNWERIIKFPGYKMYMNSIQCFISNQNLKNLDSNRKVIDEIRNYYNERLSLNNKSHHLYRISVTNNKDFIQYMKKNDVVCGIHYDAQHKNPIYNFNQKFNCPKSEMASNNTVSIPFHSKLKKNEIDKIVDLINNF